MRRIAIINQKGGVGKTTTTANLGAALARTGARVLLVDLDPQGHLSLHFGAELNDEQVSIYDVLTSSALIKDAALRVADGLTLVPADIDLAGAEAELVSVTGREVLLREALHPVAAEHDYLLIDCPPSLGVLTINALVASDEVLIPLQAQFFALQGLSKLLDTVTLVKQRINPELTVTGVVLCMHEPSTRLATEVVEDLRRFLAAARDGDTPWSNARLFDTYIRRNIRLAEASSFAQTVFDYAPKSNGAADYARLAAEIFGRGPAIDSVAPDSSIGAQAGADPDAARPRPLRTLAPAPFPVPDRLQGASCPTGL
jgi:chromosome partitioning protein